MRYGVRHAGDHSWWQGTAGAGDIWTGDPRQARDFLSRQDAIEIAFVECHARCDDYDAMPLPSRPADAHMGAVEW